MKLDDIPITLFNRIYHGNNYEMAVTLFSPYSDSSYQFSGSAVLSIVIENDLECFAPTLKLVYKDINNVYLNGMELHGQFLRVVIKQPTDDDEKTVPKYFDNIFMISETRVEEYAVAYSIFEIRAVHSVINNYMKHINYATSKDAAKISPYKIITDVMKKSGVDINTNNCCQTTERIHYITCQEQTALDVIRYCLAAGVSKENKPAFLYFNLKNGTPYLWNEDLDMKSEDKFYVNQHLAMYTRDGGDIQSPDLMVRDIRLINPNPSEKYIQDTGLDIVWNYDQEKRTWSQNITTASKITETLAKISAKDEKLLKSNLHEYKFSEYGIRHYHPNFEFTTLYKKYRDILLGTNTIEIGVRGSIVREVGQTVNINCLDANAAPAFGGEWKIYRILHVFEGGAYNNSMVLFRTKSLDVKPKEVE